LCQIGKLGQKIFYLCGFFCLIFRGLPPTVIVLFQSPINVFQTPSISSQNPTISSPVPIVSFQNPNIQSHCLTTNFTPLFLTPQGNLAIRSTSNQYQLEKIKISNLP
jgi:hypothetical protein